MCSASPAVFENPPAHCPEWAMDIRCCPDRTIDAEEGLSVETQGGPSICPFRPELSALSGCECPGPQSGKPFHHLLPEQLTRDVKG